ncbi:MAG: DUF523 domain-containing protein [Ruminococcaceae bacterium]|nr:DUF523 domain-containing protein [Oscillospiraceae bacterium]
MASPKTRILVSACLLGENCKYSGENNLHPEVIKLAQHFELIPVCPEVFGGLPIPREPAEIKDGRVVNKSGDDVTAAFITGANETLYIAREKNCPAALLKEKSPSCGFGKIYDGSFSGRLTEGSGFTARLLSDAGIQVFGESQVNKLIELYA